MEKTIESKELTDLLQADTFEVLDILMDEIVHLFSVLSSRDGIKIFLYAEQGITSSTQAIKDLGLTQKRYYARLKGLIEAGLIEKVEGAYVYTPMGEMLSVLGSCLFEVLKNKERIEIFYTLSKADALSVDERFKISQLLTENSKIGPLLGFMINGPVPSKLEKIGEYRELAKKLVEDISLAEESVLLASNYIEASVVDAQIKASRRGIKFRVLISKETMSKKLNKLKLLLSPKIFLNLLEFLKATKNNEEWLRAGVIPFSFCIIDGYKCYFELPPVESEFTIAFYLEDTTTSRRFSNLFKKLWEQSGEIQKDKLTNL